MRNLAVAAAAAVALVAVGTAVARGVEGGAQGVALVSGTFSATTVSGRSMHSCTTSAGKTIESTSATYTGTASGTPHVTGRATIAAHSTIDTTDEVGTVTGTLKVGKTQTHFSAVYDHGTVAGTATGHTGSRTQLLANVSASFSAADGFTAGKIGGGTAAGGAVELAPGGCTPTHAQNGDREARGTVTASSTSSITIGNLTCAVPPSLGLAVEINFGVGTRADIKCSLVDGTETLVKIDQAH
jgi:hypothetical protein